MKKAYSFLVNKHQDIIRYLLVILTIVLVTNWFPKTVKFNYSFEKGRPWKYENLKAPFDFAIMKSNEMIAEEKQQILANFKPFFVIDTTIRSSKSSQFTRQFHENYKTQRKLEFQSPADSLDIYKHALSLIDSVYSRGVIRLPEQYLELDKSAKINVINGNTSNSRKLNSMYDITQAYRFIENDLKAREQEEMVGIIAELISYNIIYDDTLTSKLRKDELDNISISFGKVSEGTKIVEDGELVTETIYQVLASLKGEYEKKGVGISKTYLITTGYFIICAVLLAIFTIFLAFFEHEVFSSISKFTFVMLIISLFTYLASLGIQFNIPSNYLIPFCMAPIIMRTFFGTRLALWVHLVIILMSGFILGEGMEFFFIQLAAGMIAIFTTLRAYYWTQFFTSLGLILITYLLSYLGVALMQEGSLDQLKWINFGWIAINIFLTLLAYPLIPLFEKIFGLLSEVTLVELGDLNKPLLKELSLKTPGTFQHSLQVANLAEASAYAIGANTLLVRVGALYHDIGKMGNPSYFIENQSTEVNPHDELPYDESARIIIDHVPKGIELAKKHKLPDVLIDFIRTHHGTSRVEYFYQSFLKNAPSAEEVDEQEFRYPGPLPHSKETAILMMADTVEAAAKSLKHHSAAEIDELVDRLVKHKVDQDQFVNSNVTFKDITMIKKVLKKMLKSIYHVRVSYPIEQKRPEAN